MIADYDPIALPDRQCLSDKEMRERAEAVLANLTTPHRARLQRRPGAARGGGALYPGRCDGFKRGQPATLEVRPIGPGPLRRELRAAAEAEERDSTPAGG